MKRDDSDFLPTVPSDEEKNQEKGKGKGPGLGLTQGEETGEGISNHAQN